MSTYWESDYDKAQRKREQSIRNWRKKYDIPDDFSPTEEALSAHYVELRNQLSRLEEQIADFPVACEKEEKELDKSLTLLKVGAKMLKKVLTRRGHAYRRVTAPTVSRSLPGDGPQATLN